MSKKTIFFLLVFSTLICLGAKSQVLKKGIYVGYEEIDVTRLADGRLYFYPGVAVRKEIRSVNDTVYFHQVTVIVKKDSIFMTKVPIALIKKQLFYSDSLGGFYSYTGEFAKLPDSSASIRVRLKERKFTGHSSHGPSFYWMYSYHNIRVSQNGFTADVGNLKDVVYRKVI